ncbi:uncharacterized protein [Primulina huaijiensis]|uniref:uncharacterized protein n=1 Tax=Primulina huaijiensis TaxID=1492673 RepID=UPI003CC6F68D
MNTFVKAISIAREMGIWEFIGSTTEAVKRNSPDLTPLKNQAGASYEHGSAACARIDRAVRNNGFHGLTQWMPENKTIGLYASKFAKHTAHYGLQEGYKLIPGGVAVSKIITNTLNDVKNENLKSEKLQTSSREKVVTPSFGRLYLIDGEDMLSRGGKETASNRDYHINLATKETPEDVIGVFMKTEFCGTRFLDDLMVPKVTRGKKTG